MEQVTIIFHKNSVKSTGFIQSPTPILAEQRMASGMERMEIAGRNGKDGCKHRVRAAVIRAGGSGL